MTPGRVGSLVFIAKDTQRSVVDAILIVEN